MPARLLEWNQYGKARRLMYAAMRGVRLLVACKDVNGLLNRDCVK